MPKPSWSGYVQNIARSVPSLPQSHQGAHQLFVRAVLELQVLHCLQTGQQSA